MRTQGDFPRRLPGSSRRARIIALIVVVVLIVLLASLSGLARFWTDYLWFQSVGFTSVFRGVLLTKVLLSVVFIAILFILLFGNLVIADRVAPPELEPGADELVVRFREVVQPRGRWVRLATAAVFAVLGGIGADREWNNWDLLRYHVSFGAKDPEFHKDIGFYVFELPFIKFLLGWAFEAMIVVLIVTAVAHYLNGGIHVQAVPRRVTAAVKTHLSVLLGVLALIKAVDYYFQRLELVLSRSHLVNGATNTSVHADKPAKFLLMIIAVIAAGLFLYNIREKGWTLPAVAVGLWGLVYIVIGVAYPAIYQAIKVNPSALTKETPYIARNIQATRDAFGINNVHVDSGYQYSPTVTPAQIQGKSAQAQANQQTIANVRLLDPAVSLSNTFKQYQGIRPYYSFNTLGLDRYVMPTSSTSSGTAAASSSAAGASGSAETATIASVRELNTVPSGFVNQHLFYTHGYGAVLAPISEAGVNPDGTPNFTLSDLPPTGSPALSSTGSQIYYGLGKDSGGYVIAGSKTPELDYESATGGNVTTKYNGKGGVDAGSIFRRAAFALRFSDFNFILSGQVTPSSKVMYIRNVVSRVKKAAPFLKYDSDPYPVILNGGVYWVIDAYTTTGNYPYSQNAITGALPAGSGLQTTFNYVRNSVKAVVSAYDGSMHFFVTDPSDPIIRVYERAFPDLFTPVSQADSIIPGITDHFRYPEDLFQVQTNMYGRYHLTDPSGFFTQAQAWTVSPDPGSGLVPSNSSLFTAPAASTGTSTAPAPVQQLAPQYVLAHLPGSTQQSFLLVTPFVPVGGQSQGQNLTGLMTVSSDPSNYGTLTVFQTPFGQTVDGPLLVSSAIRSNPAISSQITLVDQHGSQVELGEVAIVPIDQTLIYVQPVYVESTSNSGPPLLRDVVVVYNGKAYQSAPSNWGTATDTGGASLDAALCQITNPNNTKPFANYCNTPQALGIGVAAGAPTLPSSPGTTTPTSPKTTPSTTVPGNSKPPTGINAQVSALLARATAAYNAAGAALQAGDLASYQADIKQEQTYLVQAQALLSKA